MSNSDKADKIATTSKKIVLSFTLQQSRVLRLRLLQRQGYE